MKEDVPQTRLHVQLALARRRTRASPGASSPSGSSRSRSPCGRSSTCARPPRARTFVRRSLNPARARQGSIMMVPITIVLSAVYFSIDELGIQVRRAAARARLNPCRGSDGSGRRLTRARRGLFVRRLRSRTACCQSRGSATRSRAACARCSPTTCRPPLPPPLVPSGHAASLPRTNRTRRIPADPPPPAPPRPRDVHPLRATVQTRARARGRRSRVRSAGSAQTWRRGTEWRKNSAPSPPLPRAPFDVSERCAFDVSVRRVRSTCPNTRSWSRDSLCLSLSSSCTVSILYEGRRATRAAAMRCGVLLRVAGRVRGRAGAPVVCSTHRASNALLATLKRRHAPAANVSVARASSAKPPPPPPPRRTSPRSARNTATSAASAAVCLPAPCATSAECHVSRASLHLHAGCPPGHSAKRRLFSPREAAAAQRGRLAAGAARHGGHLWSSAATACMPTSTNMAARGSGKRARAPCAGQDRVQVSGRLRGRRGRPDDRPTSEVCCRVMRFQVQDRT